METYGLKVDEKDFMDFPVTSLQDLKSSATSIRSIFEVFILKIQKEICTDLERLENLNEEKVIRKFQVDSWKREGGGGGGISCVFQKGVVFEKAGVNVSVVFGLLPKDAANQMRARGKVLEYESELNFFAAGISSVIHPKNPHVPTIHFNYRYFEVENSQKTKKIWWFGGGVDMTPYILNVQDAQHFHQVLKSACDQHNLDYYPRFKKECDNYFFIKHRNETRGIGGIFFDDMDYPSLEEAFKFVQSCAYSFIPSYSPVVERNLNKPYTDEDREWQLIRRGRYVEFNLIYDRGTKFGLFTPNARYESILMSLPLYAKWEYCHEPKKGSKEENLMEIFKHPVDWVSKVV